MVCNEQGHSAGLRMPGGGIHTGTRHPDDHDCQHRALDHYMTGPAAEPGTLCQAFQDTVARFPDRPALRTLGGARELTWREYGREVSRMAATMAVLGVRRGDAVALMMANRIEFHVLDTAAMHLGAIPISIYNSLRPPEIAYIL